MVQLIRDLAAVEAEIGIDQVFLIIVADQLPGLLILLQPYKVEGQRVIENLFSSIGRMVCSCEGTQLCGRALMGFDHCYTSYKYKNPVCSKKVTS